MLRPHLQSTKPASAYVAFTCRTKIWPVFSTGSRTGAPAPLSFYFFRYIFWWKITCDKRCAAQILVVRRIVQVWLTFQQTLIEQWVDMHRVKAHGRRRRRQDRGLRRVESTMAARSWGRKSNPENKHKRTDFEIRKMLKRKWTVEAVIPSCFIHSKSERRREQKTVVSSPKMLAQLGKSLSHQRLRSMEGSLAGLPYFLVLSH